MTPGSRDPGHSSEYAYDQDPDESPPLPGEDPVAYHDRLLAKALARSESRRFPTTRPGRIPKTVPSQAPGPFRGRWPGPQ